MTGSILHRSPPLVLTSTKLHWHNLPRSFPAALSG